MIVFLIGGGPSAGDFASARVRSLRIGVNDAAFHVACDMFFSNDHNYALGIRDKIEAFEGERHLSVRQQHLELFRNWDAIIWRRINSEEPARNALELSSGPSGTPGCSGFVAINLAAQLGATTIVLIGYDFHAEYRYFFSNDPFPRIKVPEVVASFAHVAPHYQRRGIQIFNANPDSAITAFPRITHAEALRIDAEGGHSHEPARGQPRLPLARELRRRPCPPRVERRA